MSSRISDTEWGLLMGAAAMIDTVQVMLDFLVLGVVLNRGIDLVIGMALPFYLKMRGVKFNKNKVLTLVLSFILEMIPGIDALPLWTMDIVVIRYWDKKDKDPDPKVVDINERRQQNLRGNVSDDRQRDAA